MHGRKQILHTYEYLHCNSRFIARVAHHYKSLSLIYSKIRCDNSTKESSFSVGLQGVSNGDVETVKSVIWNTLEKVSRYIYYMHTKTMFLHVCCTVSS